MTAKADMSLNNNINYLEQQTDDVETLFSGEFGDGWEFDALQLSPGPLGARSSMVCLPDLDIYWCRYSASLHMREHHQHGAVYLTFLLDASAAAKWYGRDVESDQALLYFPRHEQDYVLPRDSYALGFMISQRLLRHMGWHLQQVALQRVSRRQMHDIAAHASRISTLAGSNAPLSPEDAHVLQERLADRLDTLLQPWLKNGTSGNLKEQSPGKQYRLVERACQRIQEWGFSQKLDIAELAQGLTVSRRSLYRAFHDCLGVGPYEYFTLLRLQQVRGMMRQAGSRRGAITDAALMLGFEHLGRFSRLYSRQYGELPRDSLRRWGDEEFFQAG